jgi:hypothetical protein
MDLRIGQALALGLAGGLVITAAPACGASTPDSSDGNDKFGENGKALKSPAASDMGSNSVDSRPAPGDATRA